MSVATDGELTNVDPALFQAWHPVARLDEVGPAPIQVMLVGRLWMLRRVSGRVVADPRPHALAERWGLVWLAAKAPVVDLFDDPDEADTRDAGAWLAPIRVPAPAGAAADRLLAGTGDASVVCDEPYGFRGVQVGPRQQSTFVYRAPFQLLLCRADQDTGVARTLLCFIQPELLTSSRIFAKLLVRGRDGLTRPSAAVLAREVAEHQARLADELARTEAGGYGPAVRRALEHLVGLARSSVRS